MSAIGPAPHAPANNRGGGVRFGLAFMLTLAGFGLPPSVAAAETIYFPHQDARFLYPFQRNGGAALVPDEATAEEPLPLVVVLHGTNPTPELHLWLGGGARDLRPLTRRLARGRLPSTDLRAYPFHPETCSRQQHNLRPCLGRTA